MSGYMQRWEGKADPDDVSGTAHFVIEAQDFVIPLPTFIHAQRLDELLWLAFRQGKNFAFEAVKGRIGEAMAEADRAHSLAMDCRETPNVRANRPAEDKGQT